MPNTKVLYSAPNVLRLSKLSATGFLLPVHGQGTFLFTLKGDATVTFHTKDKSDGLAVHVTPTSFSVERLCNSDKYVSQITTTNNNGTKSGAFFWFSVDSQNQCLQGGIGEARAETCTYKYQFAQDKLWEANKIFMESLVQITVSEGVAPLRLLKNPITASVPLKIRDTKDLTMDDVAGTMYLPNAGLSAAAQILYNSISGPKFTLSTPSFPDFANAIEYSIKTPGCWCNTRLKEKANEFGKPNPQETYLRITLGQNNGDSPGVPYVMEIWPVGHYSPIHNHGYANAVIRILHGNINVNLYPFLCDEPTSVEPFGVQNFSEGDITWLSPTLNQTHMLKNPETNTATCITIQCYKYDSDDAQHYDYFDYLGDNNSKAQYEPDSDMDFVAFKAKMSEEWYEHIKLKNTAPSPVTPEPRRKWCGSLFG